MAENIPDEPLPQEVFHSQSYGHSSAKSIDSMVTVRLSDFESIREHSLPQSPTVSETIHDESTILPAEIEASDVLLSEETDHSIPSTAPLHIETEIECPSESISSGSSIEEAIPETLVLEMPITTSRSRSNSTATANSDDSTHVDWDELERSEGQEPRDEASDEVCGATVSGQYAKNVELTMIVNCISARKARAGEPSPSDRPKIRPESDSYKRPIPAAFYTPNQEACEVAYGILAALLHPSNAAPNDRTRILGSPSIGLSADSTKAPNAYIQQDPSWDSSTAAWCRLAKLSRFKR